MIEARDLLISKLGDGEIDSPLKKLLTEACQGSHFVRDEEKVVFHIEQNTAQQACLLPERIPSCEVAGPREKIFFDPEKTSAAIVTCGGLCPGLNNVIRSLVMTLHYRYGAQRILGIRYGYEGFIEKFGHEPLALTPALVRNIHKTGGTILGTSRGNQDVVAMVDFLEAKNIQMLFVIGGDGTQRGAYEIAQESEKRKRPISVVGIPKTIDNDILHLDRTFGFATAASVACGNISTAKAEAEAQKNGIGLIKLMGRHSGFIACLAAVASNDANFVLIPEVPFDLEGERGFLAALEARLNARDHAVIIVAEGAGQNFMDGEKVRDASGNLKLNDIGLFLKARINEHFRKIQTEVNLKYIDPSYIIRAVEAIPADTTYCYHLGASAVHAAMSGRTRMVVGLVHNRMVHLPMRLIAAGRKSVDPDGDLWLSVLETTGQPSSFLNRNSSLKCQ